VKRLKEVAHILVLLVTTVSYVFLFYTKQYETIAQFKDISILLSVSIIWVEIIFSGGNKK
jgi:hypothetical protein